MLGGRCALFRLWRYWDMICLDMWRIVERLHNDARTLGRAVMVAIAVGAPLEHKGGGTHGGVMVLVATVDAVFKDFKGTPKAWSRYWPSPAFRCRSGDKIRQSFLWVDFCGSISLPFMSVIIFVSCLISAFWMAGPYLMPCYVHRSKKESRTGG
jgi:hypothetical protein